jgi:hypothetical protein
MGALTGAISGGVGDLTGSWTGLARIGATAFTGGATNWLQNAAQGHAGIRSFFQGVELGAIIGAAQVGFSYLTSSSECCY